ncbi:MAG: hypothetical protein AAF289_06220 [Cyanobacteria bacterium P01_A01_bin.135]
MVEDIARRPWFAWKRNLIGAVGAILAAGGLYGVTRPCVIGSCPPLKAEQLAVEAIEGLSPAATSEDVIQAYDLLLQHIVTLNRIPLWSPHHRVAQQQLQLYTTQADTIDHVVTAQRLGHAAAIASQNSPHPLETWQTIAQQWQQAIVALAQVPEGAPGSQVARRKLQEYRDNYAAIAARIALEQQAQHKITEARTAAALAETRTAAAQSPEAWQKVYVTWQVAFERLGAVNPYTMAHAEAQQLDALYRPQADEAQTRKQQERTSAEAYRQAQQQAQEAQTFEQQGQWPLAIEQWQQAIAKLAQVPEGTTFYEQAQPLKHTYAKSLEQSQQGLVVATAVQTARPTLDSACQQAQLCEFVAASDAIQVYVAQAYQEAIAAAIRVPYPTVNPAAASPQDPADPISDDPLLAAGSGDEASQLLNTLAALGANIRVPIEFYSSTGTLLGTYQVDEGRYTVPKEISLG